jgi:carbamoyltransferase
MKTYNVALSTWHDASIALLGEGKLELLIESERMTHKKHDTFSSDMVAEFEKHHPYGIENCGVCGLDKNSNHHIYHAAHSFYDSGFKDAVCVIVDGMGSEVDLSENKIFEQNSYGRESVSIFKLKYPNNIELVHRIVTVPFVSNYCLNEGKAIVRNQISPALMFQKTCEEWGMSWYDAGKLMAMSSYSDSDLNLIEDPWKPFDESIFEIDPKDVRKVRLSKQFNSFQEKANFCKWLQNHTQEYVRQLIIQAVELSGCKNVCLSGGYFLNCVANSYIRKNIPKDINIFVEPICSDAGVSVGLAKLMWYEKTKSKKIYPLNSIYNGVERIIDVEGERATSMDVAKLLSKQKVVSIFQSRSESGPRSLGNRSILYDPRDSNGKDKINKLKGREHYRPLASTVLYEYAKEWFDMSFLDESPFMLYALDLISDKANKVPAICHVDNTCRIQTLRKSFNPNFYNLINDFYKLTGVPMLLNTSFNIAGDTIVETVNDAIETFNNSDIDYLYFPETKTLISK